MRTCPVCDETVSMDVKICPSCSTDLSLFSAEDAMAADVNAEELKKTILSDGNGHLTDLLKAAEDDSPSPPQPADLAYDDSIECPSCGKSIAEDAAKCPHCGVEFEVEEVFECPMCSTLIDINVNKCPSCGTEFEVEEPEPESPEQVQPVAPAPVEVPKEAPKQEPASFIDRLKKIKEEPTSEPKPAESKKELSFAERMKAMKDEKSDDGASPDAQAPSAVKPKPTSETPKGTDISERLKAIKQNMPAESKPLTPEQKPQVTPQKKPVKPPETSQAPVSDEAEKREAYKELPRYIGDVKKLLLLANEMNIDVSTSKALINKAVTAGKTRDMDNAIRLVKEGKGGLERDIRGIMLTKLRTLETALGLEKKAGKNVQAMEHTLEDIKRSLEVSDFQSASGEMKKLEEVMTKSTTSKLSQVELDSIGQAIKDAESLNLSIADIKAIYEEAKKIATTDSQRSVQLTKQASESLNKMLPSYIASEMRKAKVALREIKMMNVDINAPVNMLKDTNDRVLAGDYCSALGLIKNFKDFVNKASQP
ncbi:MAG: zinc ribbon domain-containing protein [Thermoplasmata archaeon]|nr:zinc ribbon domain-containing protein [Thermoplasmata archaeon]